jgi:hypothetical protein
MLRRRYEPDMRLLTHVAILAWFAFLIHPVAAQDFNYERAMRNYQAVLAGNTKLEALTEQERNEVYTLASMLRRSRYDDQSDECRDAADSAENAASAAASDAKALARCLESGDLEDDCSTKFRRAKNSYSDYEYASSRVQSECD